jgi:L-alanine-DL-glutamate epimerase-like enolase superfamily enzyme
MKKPLITDVQTVLLTGPCTDDPFLLECRKRRSAAFIEISTDAGLVGVGETYGGYFCPELVPEVVKFFKPILVGQNVDNIDALWNRMYHCENFWCRVGLGPIVLAGIDAALWDLKGKVMNLPVYELLGGRKHERLECYATGGPSNYPFDRLAQKIDHYLSLGFGAFKVGVGSHSAVEGDFVASSPNEAADFEARKLQFVRSHVGNQVKVLLDGHMGNNPVRTWDLATAKAVVRAVEPYSLFLFEEPLHYTDPWGYTELCKDALVPIAGGECLTTSYEWRMFVERDCFDIGQPDASFTGGLGEFMKVATLLESRGRKMATHSWGAGGSLMQNIHVAFACRNTVIVEVAPDYGPLHREILDGSFVMEKGSVLPPQRPGLGIVLTQEIKDRYPFVPGSGEFNSVPGKVLVD